MAMTTTSRHLTVWDVYESPLGALTIRGGTRGLTSLSFPEAAEPLDERTRDPAALAPAVDQLEEYFAGRRSAFALDLDLRGTDFQRRVWHELRQIPCATIVSYTELAHRLGRADSVRAVGAAVGRTPVPIIVGCHRVVASDGALTGYRGGLHRKRALLDLERGYAVGAAATEWSSLQPALTPVHSPMSAWPSGTEQLAELQGEARQQR